MELLVSSITKTFGEKLVLNDISFTAKSGSAIGLLGRNGAGKTTTIRIVMGVFPPDSGEVLIDGRRISESNASFGYLPEERGLYPKQKIIDQMAYIGRLRGLSSHDSMSNSKKWLQRMGMEQHSNDLLSTLSKGNQQKIQLAVTLVCNPDIIILDEPFSGLDPVNAQMLKDVVREIVDDGKIVIFSSHQMGYVEEFCDSVALLDKGSIVLSGSIREIKKSYGRTDLKVKTDTGDSYDKIEGIYRAGDFKELVTAVERVDEYSKIVLTHEDNRQQVLKTLLENGVAIEQFGILEPSLETIFVDYVGGNNETV